MKAFRNILCMLAFLPVLANGESLTIEPWDVLIIEEK